MAMTTSSAVPLNNVRIISSGAGTITGNGGTQDITNFTCPVLGNLKRLYVHLRVRKTLGAGQLSLYFSPTAGAALGTGTMNTRVTAANSISIMEFSVCKDLQNTTHADVNGHGSFDGGDDQVCFEMNFNVEAGCVFYLVSTDAGVGNNASYSYIAYLVG